MKNRINNILQKLIYSLDQEMSTVFKGINQKIEYSKYFFKFIYNSENETKNNLYKAMSKGSEEISKTIVHENRMILVDELIKHRSRTSKQKSDHRITLPADDSCDDENHSRKGIKSYRVWDNNIKKIVKTHNMVFLSMTIGMGRYCARYVLDYRLWSKGGKTKPELFLDMIRELKGFLLKKGFNNDEIRNNIVITFDSGYSYNHVLKKLDDLGFSFVGKFHHKCNVIIEGKKYSLPDWLRQRFRTDKMNRVDNKYNKLIKAKYYKWIDIENFKWKFILELFPKNGHKKRGADYLLQI